VEDVPAVDVPALRRLASELAPSIQANDPAYLAPVIGRFSGRPLNQDAPPIPASLPYVRSSALQPRGEGADAEQRRTRIGPHHGD
jgi:hypothetical protein